MNRSILSCGVAATLPLFAGCALFASNPVPPQPSLTGLKAEQAGWRGDIHSSPTSSTPVFSPLETAKQALKAAQAQPHVNDFDSGSLANAQTLLSQAEDDWQKIAGKGKPSTDELARIADKAHRAERLAQIAHYTAKRNIDLDTLNHLEAQRPKRPPVTQTRQVATTGSTRSAARKTASSRKARASGPSDRQLAGRRVVPELLGSLTFESGTARLTKSSHSVVNRLAKLVKAHSSLGVALFGFTDSSTPPSDRLDAFINSNPKLKSKNLSHSQKVKAYQEGLSLARARDVAGLLVRAGVPSKRIGIRPMGATHPIASNSTKAGRKKNSRVEAIMVPLSKMK